MSVYNVRTAGSILSAVEFTPVSDGNVAFFTAPDAAAKEKLAQLVTSPELNQTILGEVMVSGKPVLITMGNQSQPHILQSLRNHGMSPELAPASHDTNRTWKTIAMLAVPGQFMQLASSLMRKNGKLDWGLFLFATSNLVGHAITWHYGPQQMNDKNRLIHIKKSINASLTPDIPAGEALPDSNDIRKLRHGNIEEQSTTQWLDGFLGRNSIYIGEIFCRYAGAFSLAFPIDNWKAAAKAPSIGAMYEAGRNSSKLSHKAGLASLGGKTLSLFANVEDPYDTRTHGVFDTFREKLAFKAGGWVEAGAFGTLTYDALTNPNRRIVFQGKEYRDYVGALGSALFTARYVMRHWAKFGEKQVDMEEVYAHAADCLAKMPEEKIPQLLANTAATITNHFNDHKLNYGEVYTHLKNELYTYHQIALPCCPESPAQSGSEALKRYSEKRAAAGGYTQYVRNSGEATMQKGA